MAKEKQQELPKKAEVERLAVSISKSAEGMWVIEDLRLIGNEVAAAHTLVTLDGTKGLRVVAGTFVIQAEERVVEWQKEGVLK